MLCTDLHTWWSCYHDKPSNHLPLYSYCNIIDHIKIIFSLKYNCFWGFPGDSSSKEFACNARDLGLISGWGRSPGEGNVCLLQDSCLENSVDRGAWRATVHGVHKDLATTEWLTLQQQHHNCFWPHFFFCCMYITSPWLAYFIIEFYISKSLSPISIYPSEYFRCWRCNSK